MRFAIDRDVFLSALTAARSAVESKNAIPILGHVLIRAEGESGIRLRATDLDVEIATEAQAEVEGSGAFCVPAAMLTDIVKKFAKDATISVEVKDTAVIVKSGRSRFTLSTLPAVDFPEFPAKEFTHSFEIGGPEFRRMIDKTHFAISTEETRYYLNGIFLHQRVSGNHHTLSGCATDGHRLALYSIDLPEGATDMPSVIFPRKAAALVRKLIDTAESVKVEMSSTKMRLTAGTTSLHTKLIDGTFPEYERVIPRGNDRIAKLDREAMASAAARVATVSSERGGAVKLSFGEDRLTLSVTNPDNGQATDELDSSFDGAPLDIGFNSRYLADALGTLDGDQLEVRLAEPGSPTIFAPAGVDNFLVVLMPMRC